MRGEHTKRHASLQAGGADFIHFPKAEKDSWVGLVLVWALSVAATLCVERIGQCL